VQYSASDQSSAKSAMANKAGGTHRGESIEEMNKGQLIDADEALDCALADERPPRPERALSEAERLKTWWLQSRPDGPHVFDAEMAISLSSRSERRHPYRAERGRSARSHRPTAA
jgi:hypothetical protein